jgi:sec-independent protein translocase protein TatA
MTTPAIDALIAFGMPGGGEWIVLLFIGLLVFGRRLPEVSRQLGRAMTEFRRGLASVDREVERQSSPPPRKPVPEAAPGPALPDAPQVSVGTDDPRSDMP